MKDYSIGFTAPSSTFPGATISLECIHYFENERLVETAWAVNIFAADGDWVSHPGADQIQTDLYSFVSMLSSFYDGVALWTQDDTGAKLTFWEMVLATGSERNVPSSS